MEINDKIIGQAVEPGDNDLVEMRQRIAELEESETERKRAEEALRVSHRFLEITNRHTEMMSLLKEFVAEVKNFTGCVAVGIRLLKESPFIKVVGARAIKLIREHGLYEALEVFDEPEQGFLDLEGSGLHVIGFTNEGIVFLDNSGQTKPGMNISGILDLEGNKLLSQFLDAAKGENGGYVNSEGVWPHPVNHEVSLMSAWCGMLNEEDMICVLSWNQREKGRE